MSTASSVRDFFHDLFCSRLVCRLETDLLMARSDIQLLRNDKDQHIAELRAEKAQLLATVSMYQAEVNRRVGIDPTRKRAEKPSFASFTSPPTKTSWQVQVEEHDARMEQELAEEAATAAKG
jgi:hypothetical protein